MNNYLRFSIIVLIYLGCILQPISARATNKIIREPYLQNYSHKGSIHLLLKTKYPSQVRVYYSQHLKSLSMHASDLMVRSDHDLLLQHLKPGIEYYYRLDYYDEKLGWLPLHEAHKQFTVPDHRPFHKEFTAWILGDPGTYGAKKFHKKFKHSQLDVLEALNTFDPFNPDLVFTLGDNVYPYGSEEIFDRAFFNVYGFVMSQVPFYTSFGNQDSGIYDKHQIYSISCPETKGVYYDLFSLPTKGEAGGVPSHTEAYYSVDFRSAHFVVLDTVGLECHLLEMLDWLEQDLAKVPDHKWKIVMSHHPITDKFFKNSKKLNHLDDHVENLFFTRLSKTLNKHKVDLMISGHYHRYQRTYPMVKDDVHSSFNVRVSEANTARYERGEGIIYIIAGNGGSAWKNDKLEKSRFTSFVSYEPGALLMRFSPEVLKLFMVGRDKEGTKILDSLKIINTYKQI